MPPRVYTAMDAGINFGSMLGYAPVMVALLPILQNPILFLAATLIIGAVFFIVLRFVSNLKTGGDVTG